ncbi:hypothetical protein EDD17DRAFT_74714 [Pisolithus thermaeus]|nr:hypothetical protein EDD17DRAFT_74714 [Pisolithus thermaeus]
MKIYRILAAFFQICNVHSLECSCCSSVTSGIGSNAVINCSISGLSFCCCGEHVSLCQQGQHFPSWYWAAALTPLERLVDVRCMYKAAILAGAEIHTGRTVDYYLRPFPLRAAIGTSFPADK